MSVWLNLVDFDPLKKHVTLSSFASLSALRESLASVFNIRGLISGENDNKQAFALFEPDGTPVTTIQQALRASPLLLFEGGQFVYPGVRVGFKRDVALLDTDGVAKTVVVETLSLQPLVLVPPPPRQLGWRRTHRRFVLLRAAAT